MHFQKLCKNLYDIWFPTSGLIHQKSRFHIFVHTYVLNWNEASSRKSVIGSKFVISWIAFNKLVVIGQKILKTHKWYVYILWLNLKCSCDSLLSLRLVMAPYVFFLIQQILSSSCGSFLMSNTVLPGLKPTRWIRGSFLAPFMIDWAPYHISYILPNNTLFFIFGESISQVKVSLYLKIGKQGEILTPIRCCSL